MLKIIKNIKYNKFLLLNIFFVSIFSILILSKPTYAGITYNTQTPDLAGSSISFGNNTRPLGEYIKKVYDYGVGITAILATVVLMIGGFQWIIAGGSGEKIGEAKAWITAALSGLVLALSSYMLLNLVNPDLVNFRVKEIKVIDEIKKTGLMCCQITEIGKSTVKLLTEEDCTKQKGVKNDKIIQESGVCKSLDMGPCDLDTDCITGFYCLYHQCKSRNPGDGQACDGGRCNTGLYCFGYAFGTNPGICHDGSRGDRCTNDDNCISKLCVNTDCWKTKSCGTDLTCSTTCKATFFTVCFSGGCECY